MTSAAPTDAAEHRTPEHTSPVQTASEHSGSRNSTATNPSAGHSPKPQSLRAAWPALLALCLTMLVEMMDNSVLNVALPTIGRDLGASPTDLQWIVGAYSLTFGGLLMVGGTLGDKIGRRRTLLIGLGLFGAAGLGVLLAHSPAQLIAVRAALGAFAALIAPLTMSLIFRLFDDDGLRHRAIGLIVTVSMIGFALGPTLSGLAVEHMPWQWLVVLNAPMALIAWVGVRWGIQPDRPEDRRTGGTDIPGALLSVAALGLILYSFTLGTEQGWTSTGTLLTAAAGLLALGGFVWREKTTADPMLDLSLLTLPTVRGSALLQTAVTVAMAGAMFASTQLFQFAWGWEPWRAGLANLPFVVGMLGASPLVDALVARWGHRRTAAVGSALVVVSLVLWVAGVGTGYLLCAVAMLVMTVGMRIIMTTGAVALINALPEDHTSIGSAMNDTAQELGTAFGVALIGTVTAAVVGSHLPQGAWSAALSAQFVHAQQISFWVLAGIVVVMAAIGVRTLTDSTSTDEHEG
ncbi:MFS transporter [Arthrobacter sp. UM1]|nr:MFS transporter [Arthrobacter sp. UM1]